MRGIDRVIAVILLVGAVGGAAAFARQSGSDPTARGVHLAAPPLQHVGAPGTVLIAPTPAPARVKRATVPPARRVTTPQATLRRPIQAVQPQQRVLPPVPTPAPAPVETAPAAPLPTPEPPRVLAVVPPVPQAPAPPTVDVPIVLPPTDDSGGAEQGNGDNQHGTDNGDDHGDGSGRDQGGGQQHPGD